VMKTGLKDEDGTFKDEIESMKGQNAFGSFYNSLKETRDYHIRFPNTEVRNLPPVLDEMACKVEFSGEEMFGKYLDMHSFHEQSLNMKAQFGEEHVEYVDYLTQFHKLEKVPRNSKNNTKYVNYLNELAEYMKSFFSRTNPLVCLDDLVEKECYQPFEEAWTKGEVAGWPQNKSADLGGAGGGGGKSREVDLSSFQSAQALEALGMTRLAEGLVALGLKSGGSLTDRAKRLFSVKGLKPEEYPKSIRGKAAAAATAMNVPSGDSNVVVDGGEESKMDGEVNNKRKRGGHGGEKEIAKTEALVNYLATNQLEDVISATVRHVEKRHTMLPGERYIPPWMMFFCIVIFYLTPLFFFFFFLFFLRK
jgi:splicing factor 3A subunit 3